MATVMVSFLSIILCTSVLVTMPPSSCFAKECTNIPGTDVSHTVRALDVNKHDLNFQVPYPASDRAASSQRYRRVSWDKFIQIRSLSGQSRSRNSTNLVTLPVLKEISLHRVRLAADSAHGRALETNLQYLLMLDVDRLVWSYRVTAGLSAPGYPYGGWEAPESELRGHFVGHYLSATAKMWASTHNIELLDKMKNLVNALGDCQEKMGTGYLSAFPASYFDRLEAITPVWAPYYTIHKLMAGLLDQYTVADNERAFSMLLWMAKYFLSRVESVIAKFTIERHWESLNEEFGGMNDILYRLFMLTGDPAHLTLAHLFDKPCFLGPLALQTDGISGLHSNTHIPIVVGAQMRYEATGDKLYRVIAEQFVDIINSSHSYATGGTSEGEFWEDPNRIGDYLDSETEETCTSYNLLKVIRNLFRWSRDIKYADYYERLLVNGILGIQRGEQPGVMIYMLPQGAALSKARSYHGWGHPFNSFWCCYGTGIESFSKLGDSIYFETQSNESALYVTQFVSSNVSWDTVGLLLQQEVQELSSYDPTLNVTIKFLDIGQGGRLNPAELNVRTPSWAHPSSAIKLNNEALEHLTSGSFWSVSRAWKAGDVLSIQMTAMLRVEKIRDNRQDFLSVHAILFGPYLLAGMTNYNWRIGLVNITSPSSWVVPIPASYSSQLHSFSQMWPTTRQQGLSEDNNTAWKNDAVVLCHQSNYVKVVSVPSEGTNEAAECTFRLYSPLGAQINQFKKESVDASSVSFELYTQPGRFLAHHGPDQQISVSEWRPISAEKFVGQHEKINRESEQDHQDTVFRMLPGLSGDEGTVSFEAVSAPGCFLASGLGTIGGSSILLRCRVRQGERFFNLSTSFRVDPALSSYHPISFFAMGPQNAFVLFPLAAYRDENYATYFQLS